MRNSIKAGRYFFGIGLIGLAVQQFQYADFRPVILPEWPAWAHGSPVWAYLAGAGLLLAGAIILISKNAGKTMLITGLGFLLFFLAFHVPFQLFISPNHFHFGSWSDPLKELAFAGGAFVMAGSYLNEKWAEKLIPLGGIFFSITLIVFGYDHFLYAEFVATLVPSWIPGHMFWTYFAAVALIGSGLAIILKFRLKEISLLLGIMLFLWFVVLHIPRAVADPSGAKGNEVTSVFECLAFSGIAFVISGMAAKSASTRMAKQGSQTATA